MGFEQQFSREKFELTPTQCREKFLREQKFYEYASKKSENFLKEKRKELYNMSLEDSEKTARKKAEFIAKDKAMGLDKIHALSNFFEAIVCDEGANKNSQEGWFGANAYVVPASEWDDFFNGVDNFTIFENKSTSATIDETLIPTNETRFTMLIENEQKQKIKTEQENKMEKLETETQPEIFAMATDLTFSTGARDVDKKLEKIKEGILGPTDKTKIKYMPILDIPKDIYIPRFVIAVDKNTVEELANNWVGKDNKDDKLKQQYKEKMLKHKVQFQILREILLQCEFFANFAKKNNKNDIVSAYEKIKIKINEIYNKKMQTFGYKIKLPSDTDEGYNELVRGLKSFDKVDKDYAKAA